VIGSVMPLLFCGLPLGIRPDRCPLLGVLMLRRKI